MNSEYIWVTISEYIWVTTVVGYDTTRDTAGFV